MRFGDVPFKVAPSFLVYFRAGPTGVYPASPLELGHSFANPDFLVVANLDTGTCDTYTVGDILTLNAALEKLFSDPRMFDAHVYTIHSNSVLARLARWWGIRTGRQSPQSLQPGFLKDIVEEVNKPAILSGAWRYNFKLQDYTKLLDLKPDSRFDYETGILSDMINRYVKTCI